jgi:hypothetical protein
MAFLCVVPSLLESLDWPFSASRGSQVTSVGKLISFVLLEGGGALCAYSPWRAIRFGYYLSRGGIVCRSKNALDFWLRNAFVFVVAGLFAAAGIWVLVSVRNPQ